MKHLVLNISVGCAVFALALGVAGCTGGKTERAFDAVNGGDATAGKSLILQKRCGACHTIPGIDDANGLVGPPLYFFSRRTYIAGEVPNTGENLVKWVMNPQSIEATTAMPNLDLSEEEARNVAAYLYTLE